MENLVDKRFGRLLVLGETRIANGKNNQTIAACICKCDCGTVKTIRKDSLTSGRTTSCGCFQKEQAKKLRTKHGMTSRGNSHPLYQVWKDMKLRCYYIKGKQYEHYGARGITVCPEWRTSFESFFEWALANGYASGLQIDRIDVDGCYSPQNCRWVSVKQQARNKTNNVWLEYKGKKMVLQDAAKESGIAKSTLQRRIQSGRPLFAPVRKRARQD